MVSMRHPSRALAALGVYGISSGGVKVMSNGRGLAAVAAEINNNQENAAPPQVESAPAVAVPGTSVHNSALTTPISFRRSQTQRLTICRLLSVRGKLARRCSRSQAR